MHNWHPRIHIQRNEFSRLTSTAIAEAIVNNFLVIRLKELYLKGGLDESKTALLTKRANVLSGDLQKEGIEIAERKRKKMVGDCPEQFNTSLYVLGRTATGSF